MPLCENKLLELQKIAKELRIDVLKMLTEAGSGHTGGSLSIIEILVALYMVKLRHDPNNPNRDHFILSKGHGAPALYAILAKLGYFKSEELMKLRKIGEMLQGHPFNRTTPGIDISTGSLGQGLSVANGLALAAKLNKSPARIYVLMGDGELQEGQVWEAAMTAAHYKLDNVCAIIDSNKLQIDGSVESVMNVKPLDKKWESFGWEVFESDGHNLINLVSSINLCERVKGKPSLIIAHTTKGKGISFMENKAKWHGIAPTKDELSRALQELKCKN